MTSSKLLSLLKTFSLKEIKSFGIFLASPFYNTNNDLIRCYDYIKQYHPTFSDSELSKEITFLHLYPGSLYHDKKIRYLMSDLLRLAKTYLLVKKIESNTTESSLLLMDEFANRKLVKHYEQEKSKLRQHLSKKPQINLNSFLDKIKLTDLEEQYFQNLSPRNRLFDDRSQEGSDELERYYALKKLRYACNMLNRQAVLKEDYKIDIPDDWMDWLAHNQYWDKQIIKIYAKAFLVLKNAHRPEYFEELLVLLHSITSKISQKDLKELFLYAINYCARRIREGKNEYIEKALSLYLEGIKTKALLEDGYFSAQSFNNIVKLALRLKKYDWIEDFMEEYKHFLPLVSQKNTLFYNYAELNCYKKEFNKALSYLSKVEFVDLSDQLGSRIMLCKIYYELKEEKALLSLISSFMMFLKRNKQISDTIRKTCLNFCDLLFLIVKGKIETIELNIQTTPLLTDRAWLLEKVTEKK